MPLALLALAAASTASCGSSDGAGGSVGPAPVDEVVASLGTWESFSPPLPSGDNPAGPEERVEEVVDGTTYECSVTPRSLTETPRELVMYEPNASIMWVGNLLQGRSYKDGVGSFEELSIRQRAPLKISIDLLTGENFAEVTDPSLTSVQAAIGRLIERAEDAGHRSGSSIDYKSIRLHTTLQAALKTGISANFIGKGVPIELSGGNEKELSAAMRGVLAHFTQKMFTISIELPQSPASMFSDELTPALLQEQIDAGNVGRDNLPVYIASITYGRTLTYSIFSADTEARVHAAVEASLAGFKNASGSGYLETELRMTLSTAAIRATAIGGEGTNVIDLIRTGELGAFFTTDAALTSARPISYQLNYLGDNSIAKVSETVEYALRICQEKAVNPGRFDFLAAQSEPAGVQTPYRVAKADVNGDGRDDLVLNHLGAENEVRVGLGKADGTFSFLEPVTHPATAVGGWSADYELLVGDFDGDGDDDLLWNRRRDAQPNRAYVALSDGAGDFAFQELQELGSSWATGWAAEVADVSGDGADDVVFGYINSNDNFTAVAISNGDGTFALRERIDQPVGGWSGYRAIVADVNGDLRADLVWSNVPTSGTNRVWTARSNGDGTFAPAAHQDFLQGWQRYAPGMPGDVDGDARADIVWTTSSTEQLGVHRVLGQSSGRFRAPTGQTVLRPEGMSAAPAPIASWLGDFNGDGRSDLLFNELRQDGAISSNQVLVGLGNAGGDFDFTEAAQAHPADEDWTQFRDVSIMDVNGDGIDDVVWTQTTVTARIYVALGR